MSFSGDTDLEGHLDSGVFAQLACNARVPYMESADIFQQRLPAILYQIERVQKSCIRPLTGLYKASKINRLAC